MKRIYTILLPILMFAFAISFSNQTSAQIQSEQKTSINSSAMKMSVYPLPARSYVNIYLSSSLRTQTDRLEIINITGKKVLEQRLIDPNANEFNFSNLNNLPSGVYFIAAKDKDGKMLQSAKLIISK